VNPLLIPADACNPELPGCDYHSSPGPVLSLVVLVVLGLGLLMLVAGAVALTVFLVRRRKPTTTASGPVPPGWFPDPSDNTRSRWWDGQSWTDSLSDQGSSGHDPPDDPSA
jgi:hypothetical protein